MVPGVAWERERAAGLRDVARAIVATVAYADVFQYPMTIDELHRYLIGVSASRAEVESLLRSSPEVRERLSLVDGYVLLAGRESIVETRRRRAAVAAQLWGPAVRYGHQIARLPFVRMVALTGALSVENVEQGADIDYMVVTEPGRLWVCRLLTIALVRAAAMRGDIVCPNYFLADTALVIEDQSLYTAHELTQMLPISGAETYQQMRRVNRWSDAFLPNADGAPRRDVGAERARGRTRRAAEAALRTRLGGRLERWEMERKVRKFAQQGGNPETAFSAEWCKGHFDGHGQRVMAAFAERLQRLGAEAWEA
jgi:hypothetical protein